MASEPRTATPPPIDPGTAGGGGVITREAIQGWLAERVADRLGVEPHEVDASVPFAEYGLSSTEAVMLSGDLEDWLGRRLPATLLWDHPTLESLARHLASGGGEGDRESV